MGCSKFFLSPFFLISSFLNNSIILIIMMLIITPVYSISISNRRLLAPLPPTISSFLNPHNKIRVQYGLSPLKWSSSLANYAMWYANQRRKDCRLIHSDSNYGENIFWGEGKGWTAGNAVEEWFDEKAYFNYKTNKCLPNKECLHYTQLIWRRTTSVGCAKIICSSGDTFITCNYDPHGNVMGQKPY